MDKYESTMDWWSAEEQQEIFDEYTDVCQALGDVLGKIKKRQEAEVETQDMLDVPVSLVRHVAALLRGQVNRDAESMSRTILEMQAILTGLQQAVTISIAMEQSVKAIERMMGPPPEIKDILDDILGRNEPISREVDELRDSIKKADKEEE